MSQLATPTIFLIDVKIKDEALPIMRKFVKSEGRRRLGLLKYFLEQAVLPDDGFLCFTPIGRYTRPYGPDEEDGTVPALEGNGVTATKSVSG